MKFYVENDHAFKNHMETIFNDTWVKSYTEKYKTHSDRSLLKSDNVKHYILSYYDEIRLHDEINLPDIWTPKEFCDEEQKEKEKAKQSKCVMFPALLSDFTETILKKLFITCPGRISDMILIIPLT
ncbi:uncharacterized protein LOC132930043 [Rhopalosiphum padi]|uniref:uncharacterized protein LOC132930043 n=1 Tax=Rhopalosiphum padi TaxID=40932 RepID=UPI00298DA30C|nr:uncharacterized protein LOC132930043 [Rhopalosiphum padi]